MAATPVKTRMKQTDINTLYSILDRIDKAATESGMLYWISAGTALGAVRHGGLIPWDDDGDIYILEPVFRAHAMEFFHTLNRHGLHMAPHTTNGGPSDTWFKIYDGHATFPNVDVFLLSWRETDGCWKLADSYAYKLWPKECLKSDEIRTTSRIQFGPLRLPIFGFPERYLMRTYGADWNTVVWEGWDHEHEKAHPENRRAFTDRRPALPTISFT